MNDSVTPSEETYPIATLAQATIALADVPKLRRQPTGTTGHALVLRHADEQTLAALVAVRRAAEARGWSADDMRDFAVIASPRFFGRTGTATIVHRFRQQGPIGVSPMGIPSLSLHSPSGTISVILGMHGPNFGVGGGPNHVADGFLTALALHRDRLAPVIWLVLTAYESEPLLDAEGRCGTPAHIHAVAMALTTQAVAQAPWSLRVQPSRAKTEAAPILNEIMTFVNSERERWSCPLVGDLVIELQRHAVPSNAAIAA